MSFKNGHRRQQEVMAGHPGSIQGAGGTELSRSGNAQPRCSFLMPLGPYPYWQYVNLCLRPSFNLYPVWKPGSWFVPYTWLVAQSSCLKLWWSVTLLTAFTFTSLQPGACQHLPAFPCASTQLVLCRISVPRLPIAKLPLLLSLQILSFAISPTPCLSSYLMTHLALAGHTASSAPCQ